MVQGSKRTCQTVQSAGRDGKGSFGQVQVWLARLGALWLRRGKHRLILILAATLCPNNCFPFLFVFQSSAMVEIKPPRHRLPHPPPVAEAIVRWALLSPGLDPCRSAGSALCRAGGRRITTIPIASRHQPIVNSNDRRSLAVRKVWPFLAPVPFRRARHFAFAKHRVNARTHARMPTQAATDGCMFIGTWQTPTYGDSCISLVERLDRQSQRSFGRLGGKRPNAGVGRDTYARLAAANSFSAADHLEMRRNGLRFRGSGDCFLIASTSTLKMHLRSQQIKRSGPKVGATLCTGLRAALPLGQ
jgi:hypothetical protein